MNLSLLLVIFSTVVGCGSIVGVTAQEQEQEQDTTSSCETLLQQQIQMTITNTNKPYVKANIWLPNTINYENMDVIYIKSAMSINTTTSHCPKTTTDDTTQQQQPIIEYDSVIIGEMPQMTSNDALHVLETAEKAWDHGKGIWTTQYTIYDRIEAIQNVIYELQLPEKRIEIIQILQWEIGKNYMDAILEFDRTIEFIQQVINHITSNAVYIGTDPIKYDTSTINTITSKRITTSYTAITKRSPIGIVLVLGPYNYPINELYATLIPALLLGNIGIVKIPSIGGLVHLVTIEAFSKHLPHGTINFLSGPGTTLLPSIMQTGKINVLTVIGSSNSANQLIQYHPNPHRLKIFLQLGAKNVGIVLSDIFKGISETKEKDTTLFTNMITESILGSLSYNGQRCTALKIFFVPKKYATLFVSKFTKAVETLNIGLPWQNHTSTSNTSSSSSSSSKKTKIDYSQITPLPNYSRIHYLKTLIEDAVKKGAKITNHKGGTIIGGSSASTLMIPAILYPVTSNMKIYTEEQFGPIVPIVTYDTIDEVYQYIHNSEYAQQVSIFGQDSKSISNIIDTLGTMISKINFNTQCARSPDIVPFTARRSSGIGIMSITDIVDEFSIPTIINYPTNSLHQQIAKQLYNTSTFLSTSTTRSTTVST